MWSNRQKVDGAKTKSEHKPPSFLKRKRIILYALGTVLALFAVLSPTLFYQPAQADLKVDGKTISLDIASTEAARERGLSGRKNMADDRGMLFVFQQPAATCFWMKGMNFSLDMIWLNSAKQVVHVQTAATPQSYPKSFCPGQPARYVIELDAGQVKTLGIHIGQTLKI